MLIRLTRAQMRERCRHIDRLIDAKKLARARRMIIATLAFESRDHWLLSRLATVERHADNAAEALRIARAALRDWPSCPLLIWECAESELELGRRKSALHRFESMARRRVSTLAFEQCGEGIAWARGIVADSHVRAAEVAGALGMIPRARRHLARARAEKRARAVSEFDGAYLRDVARRLDRLDRA
ncbi:MAG: hypothetical protein ACJ790_22640 [Myxococcaceae bacterium]